MTIRYVVTVQDAYGSELGALQLTSLSIARAANTVGKATLIVPDQYLSSFWHRDIRFKVWRSVSNGPRYLLGGTVWLGQKFSKNFTQKTWTIEAEDLNSVLKRRIIAYPNGTIYADKTIEEGLDDAADNLMKAFVRENYGTLATDTDRNNATYLNVEPDLSLGQIVEKSVSFRELFATCTELANDSAELGTNLYFDVIPDANDKFTFRVFKDKLGVDRTTIPISFGPAFRNLSDIELIWDYGNETTVAYVGGDGKDAARLIATVEDAPRSAKSPFGRREIFVDGGDQDLETVLEEEGRSALRKGTPRILVSGRAIDTPRTQFGRDFFYGDLVKVAIDQLDVACHIDAFSVSYDGATENLDIRLRGETEL